jgi:hypothetical protein
VPLGLGETELGNCCVSLYPCQQCHKVLFIKKKNNAIKFRFFVLLFLVFECSAPPWLEIAVCFHLFGFLFHAMSGDCRVQMEECLKLFNIYSSQFALLFHYLNCIPVAGSVNGANCKELAAKPDVDGFLVGGASLKVITLLLIYSFRTCLFSCPSFSADTLHTTLQPEFIDIIKSAEVKKSA